MDDQQQIITIGNSSLLSQSEHSYQIEDVIANRFKIIAGPENNDGIQSYLCNDLQTNEQMVLHVLTAAIATNSATMEKLENLVGKLKELNNEHVLSDYQLIKEADDKRFVVFNYPQGPNLKDFVKRLDLSLESSRQRFYFILLQIAMALDTLHSEDIMQGDLYPENIIITKNDHAVLINTGLTVFLRNSQNGKGRKYILDKTHLQFQAPELWNSSKITVSSEQYALGVTVYELLAGKLPFDDVRPDLLKKVVELQDADKPSGATPREIKGIMRAMSKSPDMRFPSNRKFIKSLIPFKLSSGQIKALVGAIVAIVIAIVVIVGYSNQALKRKQQDKAQQEAMAKQERERQEQEDARKISEVGKLQWRAKELLEEMRRQNYNVEQTFGKHIEDAEQLYQEGMKALDDNNKLIAFDKLQQAIENCEWLRSNEETRKNVKKVLTEVHQLQENDQYDAKKLFPDHWNSAVIALTKAEKQYEVGKFDDALTTLKQAEDGFIAVNQETKDYIIRQYKDLAESASNKKDWPLLRDYAMKLSELDAELGKQHLKLAMTNINIESIRTIIKEAQSAYEKKSWDETIKHCKEIQEMLQKEPELRKEFDKEVLDNIWELLDKATLEVTSNLHVIPQVQNETIICKIEIDGRICEYDSTQIVRNLALDENHHVRLIAVKDGIQYEWDDMVTCDWKGVKDLDVELRRSIDVLLEKAQACANENEWGKVLQACQQIFELEEGNQKAIKLREQALLATTTNAKIKARIEEEVVNADISGLGHELKSNDIVRQLDLGKTYTLELLCIYNGDRYEGNCTFTADWKGVKEFSVEMRKSVDILLEKVRKLAEEKKWAEVQLNCQRILELDKENTEAIKLKEMAEWELMTNLKVKAMLEGEEINAEIIGVGHEAKSNEIIAGLIYGQKYTLVLKYNSHVGYLYEASYEFTANWKGMKEILLEMQLSEAGKKQKEIDAILARTYKYAERELWNTVLHNCRKIFKLDPYNIEAQKLYKKAKSKGASELYFIEY